MSWQVMLSSMGEGMLRTLAIFFLTILFSMPLGMVVTLLRRSKFKIISGITKVYIAIMRGTPLMLQLLAWYFGPYYLFGTTVARNKLIPVVIAFSINYAAYFAEIFRGGIQSIPKGQYEAAYMLGMTRTQTFFRIILPQVVKRVVPASANEVITLVKDTSLAQVIAVTELFALAKKQQAAYASIYPLFVAGVFYYVANLLLSVLFAYVERKLNYYK